MYKIISITGTPGTGKTIIAKKLAKLLDANLISINKLLKKGKIRCTKDKKRNTRIIDIKNLQKAVNKEIQKGKINIVDSHLSHFLNSNLIIVLRTNPKILEKRLKKKKWKKSKILENVQAEILDEILVEAIEKHGKNKVVEIDTGKKSPNEASATILKILNNKSLQNRYHPGKIRWLKKYYKMLEK